MPLNLAGILPPVATPFVDDEVDVGAMRANCERWMRTGLRGVLLLGTNDPYWTVDAANVYVKDLKGLTYVHYEPNAGHGLVIIATTIEIRGLEIDALIQLVVGLVCHHRWYDKLLLIIGGFGGVRSRGGHYGARYQQARGCRRQNRPDAPVHHLAAGRG